MLDFYIINDKHSNPDYPKQINFEYVGGLEYRTFENLKTKGLIEDSFDYYSDFRWNSNFVKQKYNSLIKIENQNDSDIRTFFELISKAKEVNCGLIAYCD